MYLTKKQAHELDILLQENVEEALLKLFDIIEDEEKLVLNDSNASFESLKLFQGKLLLLSTLKQYKQRILDAGTDG